VVRQTTQIRGQAVTNQVTKLFTIEEANKALPLVRLITQDLAELSGEVFQRQQRLSRLASGREITGDDPYSEELMLVQEQLDVQMQRLNELIDELRELGAEPKNGPGGRIDLVDFPSDMDGRMVYLCWQLGEANVSHWHELDTGFAGRQVLPGYEVLPEFSDPEVDASMN
jgi:hypothetical protein|tara:strand:- start:349 stop:858 length:510 start_codon:yes stop_codon:yes gene_type:complete